MLDMNPDIRAQWCAALRSGDYRQAKGTLRDETDDQRSYCCLGVLTDLYLKAGHLEEIDDETGWDATVWDHGDGAILAGPVRSWAGLVTSNPVLRMPPPGHIGGPGAAAELNDDGMTFAEIADLIDGGAS